MPQLLRSNVKPLLRTVQNESIPNAQRLARKQPQAVTINLSASPESTPEQSDADNPGSPELVITGERAKAGPTKFKQKCAKGSRLTGSPSYNSACGKSNTREVQRGWKRKSAGKQVSSDTGLDDEQDDLFQRPSQRVKIGYGKGSQNRTQPSQSGSQLKNIHGNEASARKETPKAVFQLPEDIASPPQTSTKHFEASEVPPPSRTSSVKPTFSNPPLTDSATSMRRAKAEFQGLGTLEDGPGKQDSHEFDTSVATEGTFLSSLSSVQAIDVDPPDEDGKLVVDIADTPVADGYVRCPVCNEHVDQALVDGKGVGGFKTFRDKVSFCEAHKKIKAEELWRTKNYPTVSWERLPKRLSKLRRDISSIIDGREKSFYHRKLERRLESGKNRRALRNLEGDFSYVQRPGYYGSKGGTIMMDYIMREYSDKIRRQTTKDRVLQLIGVGGYVQAVLVPEAACLLIQADMHVDNERARAILEESAEDGDLLHEDEVEAKEAREELLEAVEG